MPIWGLPSVAQAIASPGFDAPQHCDEPWSYRFVPGQQVLVHLRGEGRNALWIPARVLRPTRIKTYPTTTLQYYLLSYLSPFPSSSSHAPTQGEFSPQDGTVKPDTPYIRALIAEELAWPVEERSFEYEDDIHVDGGPPPHVHVHAHVPSTAPMPPRHLRRAPGARFTGSH